MAQDEIADCTARQPEDLSSMLGLALAQLQTELLKLTSDKYELHRLDN